MEAKQMVMLSGVLFCLIGIVGMPYMPMSVFSIIEVQYPEGLPLMSFGFIALGLALIAAGARMG